MMYGSLYAAALTGKVKNHPFAVGILCDKESWASAERELGHIYYWTPPETYDPVFLDQLMIDEIEKLCPYGVVVAGMTFCAWRHGPSAGGVIGNPGKSVSSACGELEQLSEDVWSSAYPGGPGFAILGNRKQALHAQQIVTGFRNRNIPPWDVFREWLQDEGIRSYLYVTDGSGRNGVLSVKGDNAVMTLSLKDLLKEGN